MKRLIWLICYLPMAINAQESGKGIQWADGLTWEQIKIRAKEENKYIFIDCYTTWCGPCKAMDKQVYPLDSVGEYFNNKFISVKVQMDTTKNDLGSVVSWRKDAELIRNKFTVDAFPSFLFFSPGGELVHKEIGFHGPGHFLRMARTATRPGQVYVDPLEYNNQLMEKYLKGQVPMDSAFAYYEYFSAVRDLQKMKVVRKDLYKFLAGQSFESLFVPDRIKFIASITTRDTDKWFSVFYRHAKRVNRVMKDDNYAERLVQQIILENWVSPYLKMDMSGMMMASLVRKADSSEADWPGLKTELSRKFNRYYTKRAMLAARFTWYHLHFNQPAFARTYLKFLDHYGIGSHSWTSLTFTNNFSYNLFFLQVDNKNMLEKVLKYMKLVVEKQPIYENFDTYASLLYKAGYKEEALQWEKRALEQAKEGDMGSLMVTFFESVIDKMKKGEKLNWQD